MLHLLDETQRVRVAVRDPLEAERREGVEVSRAHARKRRRTVHRPGIRLRTASR